MALASSPSCWHITYFQQPLKLLLPLPFSNSSNVFIRRSLNPYTKVSPLKTWQIQGAAPPTLRGRPSASSTRHFWDASDSLAHLRRAVRVFSGFCSVAALTRCSRFFLYINKCVLVYFSVCEDARPVCCQSQLDRRGTFCHVK